MTTYEQRTAKERVQFAAARKQKQRQREQRRFYLVILGIVLAIFALGALFGWILGRQHTKTVYAEPPADTATASPPIEPQSSYIFAASASPSTPAIEDVEDYPYNPLIPLSADIQAYMMAACEKYNAPYALALGLVEKESSFNPDVVSKTNDYGLMQINKINFEDLLARGIDPLTVEGNIEAGLYILGGLIDRFDDYELALMAYNCGPTGAQRLWDAGVYSTNHSSKVMEYYQKWQTVLEG